MSYEERSSTLQEDLETLNVKNTELQQTLDRGRAAFAQDKKMLEDTIVDITYAEASSRTEQASRESELREQMERAKVCLVIFS